MDVDKFAKLMRCCRVLRKMAREIRPEGYKGMWFYHELQEERTALWEAIECMKHMAEAEDDTEKKRSKKK